MKRKKKRKLETEMKKRKKKLFIWFSKLFLHIFFSFFFLLSPKLRNLKGILKLSCPIFLFLKVILIKECD